jgi:hypothetical protein
MVESPYRLSENHFFDYFTTEPVQEETEGENAAQDKLTENN